MGRHGITVVIGIPSFGSVSTHFMQARNGQQFPLVSSSIDKVVLNKPIAEARNEIVQFALDQDANYIYWLDDDVIAPGDSFLKLWRHQKDIINGVYWSKSNPPMPLLFRGHLEAPYLNWHVGDLIEIDAAGNGLTLVKTDVYRKISETVGGPWYSTEYGSFANQKESPHNNTEDLYFYWKAKKAGYKIWADTSVQAFHFEKNSGVMYSMPANAPQAMPGWEIKPQGKKLIADIGSGPITPYMVDEGVTVSFDIREDMRPDVVCDVRYLPVPNDTFDIVFSSHTLEHFGWVSVDKVLKEWTRVLKIGGELRIVVPNIRDVAQRLLDDTLIPTDFWILYGEQDYAKNFHGVGFTPNVLRDLVASLGVYENIQVREGAVGQQQGANSWNLQLKATKVKNPQFDNIAPEDITPGPSSNNFYPVRIYDEYTERLATPEEITADLDWFGAGDREAHDKKDALLKDIKEKKEYPLTDNDKAYFGPNELFAPPVDFSKDKKEEVKEEPNVGLASDNKRRKTTKGE